MTNKTTRKALLLSTLSLLLCFAMLLGTTFAWFTDSVTSSGNIITAGNLDVEMYWADGTEAVPVDSGWTDASAGAIFDYDNWEPGYVDVKHIQIANEGTLALKYQVAIVANGEVSALADVIDVYYADPAAQVANRTDLSDANKIGTLAEVLAGMATTAYGELPAGENHTITLAMKMQEEAGNEYQGLSIGSSFRVVLNATQLAAEEDSFDETYDENAELPEVVVDNVADLKAALANGGVIALAADISGVDANTAITVPAGKNVTLDLDGHTLSATADKTGNQELFLVKGTMTVKNGTLEVTAQNNQGWNAMATIFDVTAGGVLNLNGVTATVGGTDMNFIVHLNNWGTATLNVDNCDFTATYVAIRAFNSGYDMNNITIKNTDFHNGRMFWVHNYTTEGKDDSTLNLDIYNNGNTSDNAKPVRFGFDNEIYFDLAGNAIN